MMTTSLKRLRKRRTVMKGMEKRLSHLEMMGVSVRVRVLLYWCVRRDEQRLAVISMKHAHTFILIYCVHKPTQTRMTSRRTLAWQPGPRCWHASKSRRVCCSRSSNEHWQATSAQHRKRQSGQRRRGCKVCVLCVCLQNRKNGCVPKGKPQRDGKNGTVFEKLRSCTLGWAVCRERQRAR